MTEEQKMHREASKLGTWKRPLKYEPYERDAQNLANDIFIGLHPEQYTDEQCEHLKSKILIFARMITSLSMAYAEKNADILGTGHIHK